MQRLDKKINIALIFIVIGEMALTNLVYSWPICNLRPPLRSNSLSGNTIVASNDTTFSTAGWVKELVDIVTSEEYPTEKITLEGLFKYLKEQNHEILKNGKTQDEKMTLLCLAIWNHSGIPHFSMDAARWLETAKTFEWISDNEYKRRLQLSHKLYDDAVETLDLLEDRIILPLHRHAAFAIAQYFREGYEHIQEGQSDDVEVKIGKEFFELCIYPERRKFVGQWERDYAEELSHMSALQLQKKWDRLSKLSGSSKRSLYLLSVEDFLGDTVQVFHPSHFRVLEQALELKRLSEEEVMKRLLYRIALFNIYLEWASRHWESIPIRNTVKSLSQTVTPSFEYIEETIAPFKRGDDTKIPFEERPIYKILTSLTDEQARRILRIRDQLNSSQYPLSETVDSIRAGDMRKGN